MTSQAYIERADRMRWFHALDLGGFQTAGRFPPHVPPNCTLFPAIELTKELDVAGSMCLDIGTAHGLMAFGLERMGGIVTATDILESPSPPFELAHEALKSSVTYVNNVPLREAADEFGMASFDVVVCAGVLYHLLDPVDAVRIPRLLLRLNGFLVLETAFDPATKSASMVLNPNATPIVKEPYTYWLPSEAGIVALLQLFGFEVVGIRKTRNPDRIAVLARSASASALADTVPEQVRRVWEVGFYDPLAAGAAWNPEPEGQARAKGPDRLDPFRRDIDIHTYQADFPPHPEEMINVVGLTSRST